MSFRLTVNTLAVATLLVVSSATVTEAAGRPDLVREALARNVEYVPSEVLVQFYAGFDESAQARALARVKGQRAEVVLAGNRRNDNKGDLVRVKLPPGLVMQDALDRLGLETIIEFAEPNWIYRHQATSNDPYVTNGSLWGMASLTTTGGAPANQNGSGASTAWQNDKANCGGVVVGIIDEGYMFAHTDLAANAFKNPGEVAGNRVDDDGNGRIDDVYGWDFAGGNNTVFDGTADDHGTHVAGTIGAVGGNLTGVAGVCWSVKLMNAKFLGANGGTTANAIKAVDYFTDLKIRHGLNLVATNNSWGGGGFSQGLKDAIDRAGAADILFIAAAGNSSTNNDITASYPSGYVSANIIAVASITSTGSLSSFSQYGATTVDIGAPGSGIWSTVPGSSGRSLYKSYSGTSMATPHVSGAAALYKARYPSATAVQIKAAILNSAKPTPSLAGKTVTGGRLDVSGF